MKVMIIFFVHLSFAFAFAQSKIVRNCPNFLECRDPEITITYEKISGIWFRYSSIPYLFDLDMKCAYINVTALTHDQQRPSRFIFSKFELQIS